MTNVSMPASILRHPVIRYAIWVLATAAATWLALASSFALGAGGRGDWQTPAFAVPLHLATVLPALPLGLWILLRPKGTGQHKLLGRIWGIMMLVTAIDSLLIREVTGSLSPLHIFSVVTLVSIPLGVWHVRRGNIVRHRRAMIGPYIGLAVAGLFALTPGRLLGAMLFG
jgi:uncharacterized membrane protein